MSDEFKQETERRLRELAAAHTDITGAAVALEKVADTQTYDVFRVRLVIHERQQDIVVTRQDPDPIVTLRDALDTIAAQVRESRDRLAQGNTHRDRQIESVNYELRADQIYATYARGWKPEDVLQMDHTRIASRLMVEQGFTQDAADFAADQILLVDEKINDPES